MKDDPALATEVYSKDVKRVQTAESVSSGEPIKALDKPPKAVILLVDDDADGVVRCGCCEHYNYDYRHRHYYDCYDYVYNDGVGGDYDSRHH